MKTKRRNPMPPHRQTAKHAMQTEKRIEQYLGKKALLLTWEQRPDEEQMAHHDEILGLRARVRAIYNYLAHRAVDVKI